MTKYRMAGKRKYQCADCGAAQMVHPIELDRARQPRCCRCGGPLDPYSKGAHKQAASRAQALDSFESTATRFVMKRGARMDSRRHGVRAGEQDE